MSVGAVTAAGLAVLTARRSLRARRLRELRERVVPSPERDRWLGKTLGSYFLAELMGRGGMASVYRGEREGLPDVAVKILNDYSWFVDPKYKERFRREAGLCARLCHPSIVGLFEAGEADSQMYLIMELVRGKTLKTLITSDGFPVGRALEILLPVGEALIYAHELAIIHRDLKPENIMIADNGQVKLMDFGLALAADSDRVTATGSVLGTLAYISPEQIQGKGASALSDQYAFGIIAYELLAGALPFRQRKAMAVVMQHLNEQPPPLRQFKPNLPIELEETVMKMLSKDPADRFSDLREALNALRKPLAGPAPAESQTAPAHGGDGQAAEPDGIEPQGYDGTE